MDSADHENGKTDNGTEFVNKTLDGWFESVGISHETSVPRSPQQNGVVERRNRTLMEAARTMLIFAKAPLFLWAEAVATACYTLNRSLVHTLHGKTYYELLKGKKPNLQYFRVFGSLWQSYQYYDDVETVHVAFDELTEGLTSVQTSSGLAPQQMTYVPNNTKLELIALQSERSRSALVKEPEPPSIPPTKKQVDDLFQWFDDDEVVPIPSVVPISPVHVPAAPAPENANGSPSTPVISEGGPAVTKNLLPHQIPLPDTSDSDVETLSKGRTVADSIAARLTRPTAYKFKTDCSIIPVWRMMTQSFRCKTCAHIHTTVSEVIKKVFIQSFRTISENQCLLQMLNVMEIRRRYIIKAFQIPTDMSM
ncbi:retrovirus-related pol polyprotein from transposon TNT 1-94 [Tanacetum coccineum]